MVDNRGDRERTCRGPGDAIQVPPGLHAFLERLKMFRRQTLVTLVLVVGISIAAAFAAAPSPSAIAPGGPDLQTSLEKGLKARRPVEFAFIASVVQMVDNGTLPKTLVETSFLWARKKRPYPFPYFEQSLKLQAQKIGIGL